MNLNAVSVSSLSKVADDYCGTGSPKPHIPKVDVGQLWPAATLFKQGDDYCGNGLVPIPIPHGGDPLIGQTVVY